MGVQHPTAVSAALQAIDGSRQPSDTFIAEAWFLIKDVAPFQLVYLPGSIEKCMHVRCVHREWRAGLLCLRIFQGDQQAAAVCGQLHIDRLQVTLAQFGR